MKRSIGNGIPITHPIAQEYILKVFQEAIEVYDKEKVAGNLPKLNLADYSHKIKTTVWKAVRNE